MMRVTINGKSAKTSLGIRVQPDDWDSKRSRCRLREHIEGKRINIFIENVISKCNRAFTTLQDEYDVVTAQMVVNSLQGGDGRNRTLGDFVFYRCHEFLVLLSKPNKHRA